VDPILNQAFAGQYDVNDRLTKDVSNGDTSYDDNGNTTGVGGDSYQYDADNKLIWANKAGKTISYVYDGDGNRVQKTVDDGVSTVTTTYLVDTNNPTGYAQVLEEKTGGSLTKVYTYGLDLISCRDIPAAKTYYFGYDGQGSVRYLTDTDGNITDTYDFDAFGNLINRTGTTDNNYLYTGEQYDPDLGMYFLRARYLDPDNGRFWGMDKWEGSLNRPLSLHKYLYCGANPTNYSDPSGYYEIGSGYGALQTALAQNFKFLLTQDTSDAASTDPVFKGKGLSDKEPNRMIEILLISEVYISGNSKTTEKRAKAVAHVVINRRKTNWWGGSLEEVGQVPKAI
jgi:RHS repeat-associated protein